MELSNVTYQGPPIDDPVILDQVPASLRSLLQSLNGFCQFGGGLHVRGACIRPEWHSLRKAWHGPNAIHELFTAVRPDWIPFAEDCVGDQFLLQNKVVIRLFAETGEIEPLQLSLSEFLRSANSNPVEFLTMQPLLQFRRDHGELPAGHLISAYPPFCTEESRQGVSLSAVPALELHQVHSELASALPEDGGTIQIKTGD